MSLLVVITPDSCVEGSRLYSEYGNQLFFDCLNYLQGSAIIKQAAASASLFQVIIPIMSFS
jgi:hypothetical protein